MFSSDGLKSAKRNVPFEGFLSDREFIFELIF